MDMETLLAALSPSEIPPTADDPAAASSAKLLCRCCSWGGALRPAGPAPTRAGNSSWDGSREEPLAPRLLAIALAVALGAAAGAGKLGTWSGAGPLVCGRDGKSSAEVAEGREGLALVVLAEAACHWAPGACV